MVNLKDGILMLHIYSMVSTNLAQSSVSNDTKILCSTVILNSPPKNHVFNPVF